MSLHFASAWTLGSFLKPQEVQSALPGSASHAEVPFGAVEPPRLGSRCAPATPTEAGNAVFMNAQPWPPRASGSTAESSSSVSMTIATSESERRKSARCRRMVSSTPS
ncbi:MAG: hypothetical protein IPQ09_10160 [Myxococcales bacterium]|nr:hypothetical protein [Myxococcales bacterium]